MKHLNIKQFALLLGLLLAALWCGANDNRMMAGYSTILIKEANVQSTPKGNTIQASIDGHYLTVTFTQDIGTLTMELDMASGPVIFSFQAVTPDSFGFYLNQTGDYIITFTLANGDEYYGEFTITD